MFEISRNQRFYLEKNGCIFGRDLHRTVGKGKKKSYYATENDRVKMLIKKYNNEVKT